MKYRLLVAFSALVLISGCAAFDNSTGEPFEGFSPDEIPVKADDAGIYTGFYLGDMTVDSNTCESVSDKVGDKVPLTLDVMHKDAVINVTVGDDKTPVSGSLTAEKATIMTELSDVKHVYYLTFGKDTVEGSCEVLEKDDNGVFNPCASYTFTLTKGEKPADKSTEKPADKPAEAKK